MADAPDPAVPADVLDRLRRLEDLAEIQQLFVDYGLLLDAGDVDGYADLFAVDGELLLGPFGRARGRDEIRTLIARAIDGIVGRSFHLVTSPQVVLDGDRASSQVLWTVFHTDEAGGPRATMLGRHVDDLVREGGRWRFARRRGEVFLPPSVP